VENCENVVVNKKLTTFGQPDWSTRLVDQFKMWSIGPFCL